MSFVVDPETGEKVPIGTAIWSKTLRRNDTVEPELQTPIGGHLLEVARIDGDWAFHVVEPWRGQVLYHWLKVSDAIVDPRRGVNVLALRDLAQLMHKEAARGGPDHLTALLALSAVT
ncbi:MAG: hypothetical protein J2P57_19835 [Acidimicrobiaceae bacterium]|nr:hypothetical protein [Acidimicrobiaceae bacterium]